MTLLLTLGGAALYLIISAALTRQFDDSLSARAQALQSLTKFEGGKVKVDISADVITRYQQSTPQQDYIAWVRQSNTWQPLAWSESLSAKSWPEAPKTA